MKVVKPFFLKVMNNKIIKNFYIFNYFIKKSCATKKNIKVFLITN